MKNQNDTSVDGSHEQQPRVGALGLATGSEIVRMKVFEMDDCEWWRAPSLEDVIAARMSECGMTREEVVQDGCPRELTEAELNQLKYVDWNPDEEEPETGWPERTFREQLNLEDEAGSPAGVFAATSDCM